MEQVASQEEGGRDDGGDCLMASLEGDLEVHHDPEDGWRSNKAGGQGDHTDEVAAAMGGKSWEGGAAVQQEDGDRIGEERSIYGGAVPLVSWGGGGLTGWVLLFHCPDATRDARGARRGGRVS